jgi:hypothetical protein
MERPTATVFVDGLVYSERRRFAAGLRKLNVEVHKVQGRRDESDEFIPYSQNFELAFLLEVTPPIIAALHLVFRPPVTDTHQQYEW